MGISRIDQPEKHNHGYYVRLTRDGKTSAKFFADKSNGGKRAALRSAREYEAGLVREAESRPKKRRERLTSRNTSGKVGVSRTAWKTRGRLSAYWQAHWTTGDGRRKSVKYSISKYGEEKARRLAMKARREGMRARGE
jgi:hypothetical protein